MNGERADQSAEREHPGRAGDDDACPLGRIDPEHRHRGHVIPGSDAPADTTPEPAADVPGESLVMPLRAPPPTPLGHVELVLARLLRVGVFLSLILIGLGVAIALVHGVPPIGSREVEPISPAGILQGLLALRGEAIIDLGLLVLIATPVLRVLAAFILFTRLRDRAFAWLTLSVLVILIGSFLAGRIDVEKTRSEASATSTAGADASDVGADGEAAGSRSADQPLRNLDAMPPSAPSMPPPAPPSD